MWNHHATRLSIELSVQEVDLGPANNTMESSPYGRGFIMKRTHALKFLNPILALLFLNQAVTGLLNEQIPYETYAMLHGYGAYLFILVAVTHIILNWNWIKASYFKR